MLLSSHLRPTNYDQLMLEMTAPRNVPVHSTTSLASTSSPSPPPSPPSLSHSPPSPTRVLGRLKLHKPLFINNALRRHKATSRAAPSPINDRFAPPDPPSTPAGPRSPAKAWRLLGIASAQSSPGRTPTGMASVGTCEDGKGREEGAVGSLGSRPSLGRLYTAPGRREVGESRPMAPGTVFSKLSSTADYSIQHSLGPTPKMSFSNDDFLSGSGPRPFLTRSHSAHPLRPRRSDPSLLAPPFATTNPAKSVPLSLTPQIREPVAEPEGYLEADLMPHTALRDALFKASLEASNLSLLGSTAANSRAPSRALGAMGAGAEAGEGNSEALWPPVHLASRFSDATSTAGQSVESLASVGTPMYADVLGDYGEEEEEEKEDAGAAGEQLARLQALERIAAETEDPRARARIAEWVSQPTSHVPAVCSVIHTLFLNPQLPVHPI